MSVEENKALVRRSIEEPWNEGNLDAIDELYAAEFVPHALWPHPINPRTMEHGGQAGLAEIKRLTAGWRSSFPDGHTVIENMMAEGDRVMCWKTTTGTNTGEHFGIAPTGNQVTYTEFSVVRIAGGKIAEEWYLWDRLGFLQQLGIVADTGALIARAKSAA